MSKIRSVEIVDDCKDVYAAFAEQCFERGYRAFKIHRWNEGDARREAENVLHVAKRSATA